MKYLKKFNELKSSTYKSAADKLKGLGHSRRSSIMSDYVATAEEKERFRKIKETRDNYAHTGVFKASVVFEKVEGRGENRVLSYVSPLKEKGIEGEMTGNFHLAFCFDEDIFSDRIWDYIEGENSAWLNFTLGITPADEETASWFCTEDRGMKGWDSYWDGLYVPSRPYARITNEAGNFDPKPIGNENWESDRFVFEGRTEAVKFRKLIIDIFEGKVTMPYDPAGGVKKALAAMPTFDKVLAVKRILASSLPNNKFDDKKIKEMIAKHKRWDDAVSKLIDSSGGEWNREDLTEEVVAKVTEEIAAMIDEMTEAQYKLFVEKSVKQIKLNDFYR